MKRFFCIAVSVILIIGMLSGCGNKSVKSDKLSIVTTIFPEYDWVKSIIGDSDAVSLTLLTNSGTDFHSYQPSAEDIVKISSCDIFIYVGGESDKWVKSVIEEAVNGDIVTLSLLDILGSKALEEEIVEGMQAEEKDDEKELDEHVWLSLKNAQYFVEKIAESICKLDKENADIYRKNTNEYMSKLQEIDGEYSLAFENSSKKPIVFADRFPFRYLTEDYGIDYYAAFMGCSSESEASFDTVTFLANKVNENSLDSVAVLEGSNKKIAETVIKAGGNGNISILTLDSMQKVSDKDIKSGKTYLKIAESNLETIKTLLR